MTIYLLHKGRQIFRVSTVYVKCSKLVQCPCSQHNHVHVYIHVEHGYPYMHLTPSWLKQGLNKFANLVLFEHVHVVLTGYGLSPYTNLNLLCRERKFLHKLFSGNMYRNKVRIRFCKKASVVQNDGEKQTQKSLCCLLHIHVHV